MLPDLPLITDFAHSATERQVLELLLASSLWGRPLALPPGVPDDRVAALRKAFTDMASDSEFLAEAAKLDIDIEIMDANRIQDVLARAYRSPPDVIDAARQAIAGN